MALAAPQGVREQKKLARHQAIKSAARDLFTKRGYDGTTTLEVANRAGIAEGTLFLYAQSKQELLLMLVNDDIEEITQRALAELDPAISLLDQVMQLFAVRYKYWAKSPDLSRQSMQTALTQRVAPKGSPQSARYEAARTTLRQHVVDLVQRQQARGHIAKTADAVDVAGVIVAIFLAEVRLWVVDPVPNVKAGTEKLRRLLHLALSGVVA